MSEDAKTRAREAYNAAADRYDDPANAFWDRFGRGTVERLGLRPGAKVLDVCCGSGASALPAAETVGPSESVVGVDLADNLLALGRAKAERLGLSNIEFRAGDMLELGFGADSFDAVVCVFGVFFVPDPVSAAKDLWRLVRREGCWRSRRGDRGSLSRETRFSGSRCGVRGRSWTRGLIRGIGWEQSVRSGNSSITRASPGQRSSSKRGGRRFGDRPIGGRLCSGRGIEGRSKA
jgi:SAM-dependent methyltransferase